MARIPRFSLAEKLGRHEARRFWGLILFAFAALVLAGPFIVQEIERRIEQNIVATRMINVGSDVGTQYLVEVYYPRLIYLGKSSGVGIRGYYKRERDKVIAWTPDTYAVKCDMRAPDYQVIPLGGESFCKFAVAPKADGTPLMLLFVEYIAPKSVFHNSIPLPIEVAKPLEVSLANITAVIGIISALAALVVQFAGRKAQTDELVKDTNDP